MAGINNAYKALIPPLNFNNSSSPASSRTLTGDDTRERVVSMVSDASWVSTRDGEDEVDHGEEDDERVDEVGDLPSSMTPTPEQFHRKVSYSALSSGASAGQLDGGYIWSSAGVDHGHNRRETNRSYTVYGGSRADDERDSYDTSTVHGESGINSDPESHPSKKSEAFVDNDPGIYRGDPDFPYYLDSPYHNEDDQEYYPAEDRYDNEDDQEYYPAEDRNFNEDDQEGYPAEDRDFNEDDQKDYTVEGRDFNEDDQEDYPVEGRDINRSDHPCRDPDFFYPSGAPRFYPGPSESGHWADDQLQDYPDDHGGSGHVGNDKPPKVPDYAKEACTAFITSEKHCLPALKGFLAFACDIEAENSRDYYATLKECQTRVHCAGGNIINDFEYLGGFLYEIQAENNPLFEGDYFRFGGTISVRNWDKFPLPEFNGLQMNPFGGAIERLVLRTVPDPDATPKPKPKSLKWSFKRRRTNNWVDNMDLDHYSPQREASEDRRGWN